MRNACLFPLSRCQDSFHRSNQGADQKQMKSQPSIRPSVWRDEKGRMWIKLDRQTSPLLHRPCCTLSSKHSDTHDCAVWPKCMNVPCVYRLARTHAQAHVKHFLWNTHFHWQSRTHTKAHIPHSLQTLLAPGGTSSKTDCSLIPAVICFEELKQWGVVYHFCYRCVFRPPRGRNISLSIGPIVWPCTSLKS